MIIRQYDLPDQKLPGAEEVFEGRLEVIGISLRSKAALAFCNGDGKLRLELEREKSTPVHSSAIRIIGIVESPAETHRHLVGYVPEEVTDRIINGGFFEKVKPELLLTYVNGQNVVAIVFQILGPAAEKDQYKRLLARS